jgi:hypothetical protein
MAPGPMTIEAGLSAAAAHRRLDAGAAEHTGVVFTVEIEAAELAGLLEDLVAVLGHDGEPRR